jgi:hypothetical protein
MPTRYQKNTKPKKEQEQGFYSVDDLIERANTSAAYVNSTNLAQGLCAAAKWLRNKIEYHSGAKTIPIMYLCKEDFAEILRSYRANSSEACKRRVLREALIKAGFIQHKKSSVNYEGIRSTENRLSKSDFVVCYSTAEQRQRIQAFIAEFSK